jgi:DNA polymerase-3 subunit epsilon
MDLRDQPLASAEFLAVDTETNGRPGDACELTEVGAVLVGGGELHDRWSSLVAVSAPLSRGIQRFTGITQSMVDAAPPPEAALTQLAERMRGRTLVAHSAGFDRRVLRQAFARAGREWPDPPVLCTVALARRLLPLQQRRKLTELADALGIEVTLAHRALADAETCGRVFCALFPKLRAHAASVGEAMALLRAKRAPRRSAPRGGRPPGARRALPQLDWRELPDDPGVYLFRDGAGRVLYVGKSVSVRSRARSHFAPSSVSGEWTAQAEAIDYRPTHSELGALVLESRLIKELRPPGNVRLRDDRRSVYVRCRFDIPFPVLEVASDPADGRAVSIGPLRGRSAASELVEQLGSLFGLRHCGRTLPAREHPSAYGQMGRCLSPCLGDLDPNAYRARLDAALGLFEGDGDAGARLLAHIDEQMRSASRARRYERAASLLRRRRRLEVLLGRLDGVLAATHASPRLVLARHPAKPRWDALWLARGRVLDFGPLGPLDDVVARTARAARGADERGPAFVPPAEVDEIRIVTGWLAAHPDTAGLALRPAPSRARLRRFLLGAGAPEAGSEGELDDLGRDARPAYGDGVAGLGLAPHERQRDRAVRRRERDAADGADAPLAQQQLIAG